MQLYRMHFYQGTSTKCQILPELVTCLLVLWPAKVSVSPLHQPSLHLPWGMSPSCHLLPSRRSACDGSQAPWLTGPSRGNRWLAGWDRYPMDTSLPFIPEGERQEVSIEENCH